MHNHIAAAGQQLEREITEERMGSSGISSERHRHRNRLRHIAHSLVDQLEGESIHDALTALYIAGEKIVSQSPVKVLPRVPGASTNQEAK